MAYVIGSVPLFDCLVRKEYLHGRATGHGEFVDAIAHAVRCVRGHSLWFQIALCEPYGGVSFVGEKKAKKPRKSPARRKLAKKRNNPAKRR